MNESCVQCTLYIDGFNFCWFSRTPFVSSSDFDMTLMLEMTMSLSACVGALQKQHEIQKILRKLLTSKWARRNCDVDDSNNNNYSAVLTATKQRWLHTRAYLLFILLKSLFIQQKIIFLCVFVYEFSCLLLFHLYTRTFKYVVEYVRFYARSHWKMICVTTQFH